MLQDGYKIHFYHIRQKHIHGCKWFLFSCTEKLLWIDPIYVTNAS